MPDPRIAVLHGTAGPGSPISGLVLSAAVLLLIAVNLLRSGGLPGCWSIAGGVIFGVLLVRSWLALKAGRRGELEWRFHPEGVTIVGPLLTSAWAWSQIRRVEIHPNWHSRWAMLRIRPRFLVMSLNHPMIHVRKDRVDLRALQAAMQQWVAVRRCWW